MSIGDTVVAVSTSSAYERIVVDSGDALFPHVLRASQAVCFISFFQ